MKNDLLRETLRNCVYMKSDQNGALPLLRALSRLSSEESGRSSKCLRTCIEATEEAAMNPQITCAPRPAHPFLLHARSHASAHSFAPCSHQPQTRRSSRWDTEASQCPAVWATGRRTSTCRR